MSFYFTIQVSEIDRATLPVLPGELISAVTRPAGGTTIRVAGGAEYDILEAVADIRLQCETLGIEVPAGVANE